MSKNKGVIQSNGHDETNCGKHHTQEQFCSNNAILYLNQVVSLVLELEKK